MRLLTLALWAAGLLGLSLAPAFAGGDGHRHGGEDPGTILDHDHGGQDYPRWQHLTTLDGAACCDRPRFRYKRVEAVPEGHTGRVFVITPYRDSGYQELGW